MKPQSQAVNCLSCATVDTLPVNLRQSCVCCQEKRSTLLKQGLQSVEDLNLLVNDEGGYVSKLREGVESTAHQPNNPAEICLEFGDVEPTLLSRCDMRLFLR